jgi:hypothetical protein
MVARSPGQGGSGVRVSVRSLDVLARRQLDAGGLWRVHSVFAHACNLVGSDGALLGIVTTAGGNAPATLVLGEPPEFEPFDALVSPGESATDADDVLQVGQRLSLDLSGALLWLPATVVRTLPTEKVARRLLLASTGAVDAAPTGGLAALLPEALSLATGSVEKPADGTTHDLVVSRARLLLANLAAAIRERRWTDTRVPARSLSGLGPGLTPSGDDLLAGLALGLRASLGMLPALFEAALTDAVVGRTTDLAAARVRHAAAGHPDERTHRLLVTLLMAPSSTDLSPAVRSLLEFGHSSGADTLVGLLAGIRLGM